MLLHTLHCRSDTPYTLSCAFVIPVPPTKSCKAMPTFHCRRKLSLSCKNSAEKGSYISDITHQNFFKNWGCSKPLKDHINAKKIYDFFMEASLYCKSNKCRVLFLCLFSTIFVVSSLPCFCYFYSSILTCKGLLQKNLPQFLQVLGTGK